MFDFAFGHKGFVLPDICDSPSFKYLNTPVVLRSFYSFRKESNLPIEVIVEEVYIINSEGVSTDIGIPPPFAELAWVLTVGKNHPVCSWTLLAKDLHSIEDLNSSGRRRSCFT
jgi:hypothetical protein